MIPLFKPSCTDAEVKEVNRVLRSGWWGMGPETIAFEKEFAKFVGVQHAVAVNSCTSALELAARACRITGKTVAVPAMTFVSTAQAMLHAGNKVVFTDVEEDDLVIDWKTVPEEADAVVPVWFGGSVLSPEPCFNSPWPTVPIIEDCAHAAGSPDAGQIGWAACWSFHAVKNLATGDGGMVTTDDPYVYERLLKLRWCGIDKSTWERDQGRYGWDYDIPGDGEKMHMNDITAALGRVQLRRLHEMNGKRQKIAQRYTEEFYRLKWLTLLNMSPLDSNHLYIVRLDKRDRNRFIDHMLANGVSAGVHYKPLTHYPNLFPGEHHVPVTERVWTTLVTLPLFPDMTDAEVSQVISAVRSFKV
jgi:perosamine synthetase